MIHFLAAGENIPFTISLALMIAVGALELIFSLFGVGLSHLLESNVPDLSHPSADANGLEEVTPLSRLLGWLRVGQVPLLMLFVVFLTAFGLVGLCVQYGFQVFLGFLVPAPVAAPLAFLAALPCTRVGGGWLGKLMPKDETEAVSEESFIGRIAQITVGHAAQGRPAEARLQDQFKQSHYIQVEPGAAEDVFPAGTVILLVKRQGSIFKAIRNPNPALVD